MKLAVINYKIDFNEESKISMKRFIDLLECYDVDVNLESNYKKFEEKYGSLGNYDGLIIHPGLHTQRHLREIREKYPNLKFALGTLLAGFVNYNYDVPVFDFGLSIDSILDYFEITDKKI